MCVCQMLQSNSHCNKHNPNEDPSLATKQKTSLHGRSFLLISTYFMWKCGIVVKESLLLCNERDVFSHECGAAIEFFTLVL